MNTNVSTHQSVKLVSRGNQSAYFNLSAESSLLLIANQINRKPEGIFHIQKSDGSGGGTPSFTILTPPHLDPSPDRLYVRRWAVISSATLNT